jgi:hypothetical protein
MANSTSVSTTQEAVAEGVSYVPVVGGIASAVVRYAPAVLAAVGVGGKTVATKNKEDEARSKMLLACAKAGDYGAVRVIVTEAVHPNANTASRRPERVGLYIAAMKELALSMPAVVAQAQADGPVGRNLPGDAGDYGDAKKCPRDSSSPPVNGAPATPFVYTPSGATNAAPGSSGSSAPSLSLLGVGGGSGGLFLVGGVNALGLVLLLRHR